MDKNKRFFVFVMCIIIMASTAGCGSASKAPAENSPTVTDASAESADTTVEKPSTTETAKKNTEDSTEAVTGKPTTTEADKKTTEAANEAVAVKPSTTEKPSTTVTPSTTEKPAVTEAPATTEKPATMVSPTTTEATTTERPATTEAAVCSHNWIAVTKEVKTTKEIPVTKSVATSRCKACGWVQNPDGSNGTYTEHVENSGTKIVVVFGEEHEIPVCGDGCQTVPIDVTTYETVTETETVVDHYECSKCGAAK